MGRSTPLISFDGGALTSTCPKDILSIYGTQIQGYIWPLPAVVTWLQGEVTPTEDDCGGGGGGSWLDVYCGAGVAGDGGICGGFDWNGGGSTGGCCNIMVLVTIGILSGDIT